MRKDTSRLKPVGGRNGITRSPPRRVKKIGHSPKVRPCTTLLRTAWPGTSFSAIDRQASGRSSTLLSSSSFPSSVAVAPPSPEFDLCPQAAVSTTVHRGRWRKATTLPRRNDLACVCACLRSAAELPMSSSPYQISGDSPSLVLLSRHRLGSGPGMCAPRTTSSWPAFPCPPAVLFSFFHLLTPSFSLFPFGSRSTRRRSGGRRKEATSPVDGNLKMN